MTAIFIVYAGLFNFSSMLENYMSALTAVAPDALLSDKEWALLKELRSIVYIFVGNTALPLACPMCRNQSTIGSVRYF